MSSEATTGVTPRVSSLFAAVAWTILAAAVALGAAGLAGQLIHTPGGPHREELTYTGDTALSARLDTAAAALTNISGNVDRMAAAAKAALGSVANVDPTDLKSNLERGNGAAALISGAALDLRSSLTGLPGDGPGATVDYSNAVLVRRAKILAAMDASLSLAQSWSAVTARSLDAARTAGLLNTHAATIANATALGRAAKYADAVSLIETAKITLADIASLRDQLLASGDVTVLDTWIERYLTFDNALERLYNVLRISHGKNNLSVQDAYRNEEAALQQLPADNRAIIVIVAEIAEGGLNQAVLAVDDAQGRIEAALGPAAP